VSRIPLSVVGVTAVGFALRAPALDQSLFGDELFTYYVAGAGGLDGVLDRMEDVESNPPLFYVLAWIHAEAFDPTVSIRIPSLVFATAAIPAVYALGARLARPPAALLAAALVALSPFATFYGIEARAYAGLTLFSALSTLSLVNALDTGRGRSWTAFWAASTAAVYTHYTAVFVLAAQAGWAALARRDRLRGLVLAHVAVVVAYLPWLPSVRSNVGLQAVAGAYDLTAGTALTALLRLLWGHPIESLAEVPGAAALILLGAAAAIAGAGAALRVDAVRSALRSPPPRAMLVVVLAAATPFGLLAYDLVGGPDLYAPRNLQASLPALAVAVAGVVLWLPRPLAVLGAALVLGAATVGSAQLLTDEGHARPALRKIAERIDANARPGDRVVDSPLFFVTTPQLQCGLTIYFDREHAVYRLVAIERVPGGTVGIADPRAWRGLRPGQRVFVAGYEEPGAYALPRPPATGMRFREVAHDVFEGLTPVTLRVYEARKRPRR
jgi:mannosyltransferase